MSPTPHRIPPAFPSPNILTDQLNPVQRQSLPSFTELVILQSLGNRADLSNTTREKDGNMVNKPYLEYDSRSIQQFISKASKI